MAQDRLDFDATREPEKVDLRARASDPETSTAAMEQYDEARMQSAAGVVLWLHREFGPLAEFELLELFRDRWDGPCDESLHRQARNQLRNEGLIRDSGRRKKNPKTNRMQVMWEACDQAKPTLQKCPTCGHVTRVAAPGDNEGS
jgi:hypothetical protein